MVGCWECESFPCEKLKNVWKNHSEYLAKFEKVVKEQGIGKWVERMENLYKEGKIGKTHEILIGSNKYKIGGRLSEGTVSVPPKASRVQHRHWEIAQMYKYRKRKEQESV